MLSWNDEAPGAVAVLLHGFMDVARSWDAIAPRLAREGLAVLAPDFRGFGDTDRVPSGAYYHFADYVADLADLMRELVRDRAVYLVGHSMGGAVATYFAGAFPETVVKLALLEGAGPPDSPFASAPERVRTWIEGVRRVRQSPEAPMPSMDHALTRLKMNHPQVPESILRSRIVHLVKRNADGTCTWKFDPLHRTRSPIPFYAEPFRAFVARITAPTLWLSGGPSGFHPPDEGERLEAFASLERHDLAEAGHMMHWTAPEAVAARLLQFWSRA